MDKKKPDVILPTGDDEKADEPKEYTELSGDLDIVVSDYPLPKLDDRPKYDKISNDDSDDIENDEKDRPGQSVGATKITIGAPDSDTETSKEDTKMSKKHKKSNSKHPKEHVSFREKRKGKKEAAARRRAEDLAKLPKEPVKRFFARLHPKRVFRWWFSWRGQKRILQTIGVLIILGIIGIGGLFLYYKKDLDEIRLDEMDIAETVNTYLDRNGVVLWQDTGSENYRLVVDYDDISEYMRQATIAIEDRNFYNHIGVDFFGLARAVVYTVTGQQVQGGSTLTQQLIKQVYFSDEAASADRGGLQRKIKELILAIELERMYSKDEIITMYLNQSPYGGRRNGVESAAQTYFGKSAKDLTLAESALLASIPNNPAVFNPYNEYGHEQLLWRQHYTLDVMVDMGFITKEEAEAAKEVAILDTILPESSQYANALAPHFVLEVRSQLEEKYGISTMRAGGWTIKTTLDYRAQKIAEEAVEVGMSYSYMNGTDNMAMVSVDVETSQVIAMVGAADFSNPTYGELNVTTDSLIEPGSSIKPILDYSALFMQRDGINYGPGSILKDENIDSLYCAGYSGACSLQNASGQGYHGNVTIRYSLGHSLNIAAVKALYINGIDNSLEVAHALGDVSYCEGRSGYGLSIAIGSGCGVRMVEHANAYASIARGGSYKDLAYVLEVKNSTGDVIESWTDSPSTRVVDEQVAYMVADILGDNSAGTRNDHGVGFVVPGVWTATKTGTTTTQNAAVVKDSLIESFSTAISTFVWNGNHDGTGFSAPMGEPVRYAVGTYMERVHKEVYEPDGKWHAGDQPVRPAGIQTLTVNGKTDIWPSWFNAAKNSGVIKETLTFNKVNHLLAADCTPEDQKIAVEVTKVTDPITGKESYNVPEPYNREQQDTCDYKKPQVSLRIDKNVIRATISKGTYDIAGYTLYIDGVEKSGISLSSSGIINGYTVTGNEKTIRFDVSDTAGTVASGTLTLNTSSSSTNVDDNSEKSTSGASGSSGTGNNKSNNGN
ncbi:penicillin-binding protein [Candidatus Saccharibacteria bacterium]|nr:penicillin-binding protein [Candidatus Saccharibacteria bacterium]